MALSEVAAANLILAVVFLAAFILGYLLRRPKTESKHNPLYPAPAREDVSNLKKLNKELEAQARALEAKSIELVMANKRLQSLEEAKTKFIAVTTHQMRTPLAAIKWTFNMILSGQLGVITDDQKGVLQNGYQSTERMIGIVNELLSIDKIEAEKMEYNFTPIQLEELVESILFEFKNQAESKKMELVIKKPTKTLPVVEVDPLKLRMVLENLIDNAIKYNRYKGKVEVTISDDKINTSRSSVEIIVKDNGIGIPVSERGKVFNKFFRAGNAVSAEPDGSGLGLYLSKDIIEKHGGTIRFETGEGGTAFHLDLPLHHTGSPVV